MFCPKGTVSFTHIRVNKSPILVTITHFCVRKSAMDHTHRRLHVQIDLLVLCPHELQRGRTVTESHQSWKLLLLSSVGPNSLLPSPQAWSSTGNSSLLYASIT